MATLTHQSPLGALEIPTVLGDVLPGVSFDVDDDIAITLLVQGDVFLLVNVPKITELRKLATAAEIPTDGLDAGELVVALAAAQVGDILTTAPITADTAPANAEEATA